MLAGLKFGNRRRRHGRKLETSTSARAKLISLDKPALPGSREHSVGWCSHAWHGNDGVWPTPIMARQLAHVLAGGTEVMPGDEGRMATVGRKCCWRGYRTWGRTTQCGHRGRTEWMPPTNGLAR